MRNFYEVLGISDNATTADIRAAYKRLAKQYHPDRNPGNKEAEEIFKVINEAYHTLCDPLKRSRYNMMFSGFAEAYENVYWEEVKKQQELKKKRYYQWKHAQENRYRFDRNYFKIQGLAFLVFLIIAGFCFAIIHSAHYYVRHQQEEREIANNNLLKQVNGLFVSGKFDDAFNMIHNLEKKDPLEYSFGFTRDSLVDALRTLADQEYARQDFSAAIAHYKVLKNYEHPLRFETLENMSMCQYYLGNYEESLQSLKHLHNQQPYNLGLIYQIGIINLEKLHNAQEALHYFTLGKKIFKENLSQVYGSAFQIVMNPADAPDIYYHLFVGRAYANLELKKYKDAITDCNWAIFLRSKQAEPYYIRALAGIDKREWNNVCEDLTKAQQLGIININGLKKRYCE